MSKSIILVLIVVLLGFSFFLFFDEDRRWVLFNRSVAEEYASALLSNENKEVPNQLIDYSVSASNGYVLFSKHDDHEKIYGYFPNESPSKVKLEAAKLQWKSLGDNWYSATP